MVREVRASLLGSRSHREAGHGDVRGHVLTIYGSGFSRDNDENEITLAPGGLHCVPFESDFHIIRCLVHGSDGSGGDDEGEISDRHHHNNNHHHLDSGFPLLLTPLLADGASEGAHRAVDEITTLEEAAALAAALASKNNNNDGDDGDDGDDNEKDASKTTTTVIHGAFEFPSLHPTGPHFSLAHHAFVARGEAEWSVPAGREVSVLCARGSRGL